MGDGWNPFMDVINWACYELICSVHDGQREVLREKWEQAHRLHVIPHPPLCPADTYTCAAGRVSVSAFSCHRCCLGTPFSFPSKCEACLSNIPIAPTSLFFVKMIATHMPGFTVKCVLSVPWHWSSWSMGPSPSSPSRTTQGLEPSSFP